MQKDGRDDDEFEEYEEAKMVEELGLYKGKVRIVSSEEAEEEIVLLWGIQQPILSKHNAFVKQSSLKLSIDACGRSLSILQSPSSLGTPGVTGAVMWDSGVALGKFLEHAVESGTVFLKGKKVVELGSGCGLVGIAFAPMYPGSVLLVLYEFRFVYPQLPVLMSASAALQLFWVLMLFSPDLPDRLRLLKKNIEVNLYGDIRGSALVNELTWGDDVDPDLLNPLPDYVLGSDVIYSEEAVMDLLTTLSDLCGTETTIILAGELRNDAILEYFLEAATKQFIIGCIDQKQWHPDYCSQRIVIYVLVKK